MYFRDSSTRSLIKLFASKGITTAEYSNLLQQLNISHPDIVSLLRTIEVSSYQTDAIVSCPKTWSSLFLALASNTPICGLLHPSDRAINLIESICTVSDFQKDISMMHILQEEVPLLFKLFSDIDGIPPPLFSILRTMLKIAYQPFLAPDSNLENYCNADDNEDISLSYFPSLPIIRQRGNYRNDLNRKQSICNKKGAGHPTLLPGIFTLFCSHGN